MKCKACIALSLKFEDTYASEIDLLTNHGKGLIDYPLKLERTTQNLSDIQNCQSSILISLQLLSNGMILIHIQ